MEVKKIFFLTIFLNLKVAPNIRAGVTKIKGDFQITKYRQKEKLFAHPFQARSHRYGLAARAVALFWPICIEINCRPYRFFQPRARGPFYPQVGPQNQVQPNNKTF